MGALNPADPRDVTVPSRGQFNYEILQPPAWNPYVNGF